MMEGLSEKLKSLELYARLYEEWGARGVDAELEKVCRALRDAQEAILALELDAELISREPDDYAQILALRPKDAKHERRMPDQARFLDKLQGALLCRFAGCTLGANVELWPVERMEAWAKHCGDAFPPVDYWNKSWMPEDLHYGVCLRKHSTRSEMKGVPVDDDITYTLLGLLIAEKYGVDFATEDVGQAWLDWLPVACTAEDIALKNLKKGVPARQAAEIDNPYCQWIGADIRSDPWAYIAAGWPQKAAQMGYMDAYLSHRRGGIYGEMYLAAAQAAAFVVDDAEQALRIGLEEIPAECTLARDIRWSLDIAHQVSDWREARRLVDERFHGMSPVHTNNNMCLMIFGLILGGKDVTRVLGEIVAMGMDNDCTAASAGSIVGALVGAKAVPEHWWRPFEDTVKTYLIGYPSFSISDVASRFAALRKALGA